MLKKSALALLALLLALPVVARISFAADAATETVIRLSDSIVTVDGASASTDPASPVYVGAAIVYYEAGHDATYGEGTAADAHEAAEAAAHTVVTITEPGTYRVSGTLSAGQLAVDLGEDAASDPNARVTLVLDGANITSTVAPAIIFYNVYEPHSATEDTNGVVDLSAAGAQVVLADGSVNTVKGSYVARIYKPGTTKKQHKYDAAFYSKMSMRIAGEAAGTGELRIDAANEGLDSELHLTIDGGNIYIQSRDDGINTNEDGISVTTINGGYLQVNAGLGAEGDGIDSNGYLTINGGMIVTMANERSPDGGIDADKNIALNGGKVIALGTRNDAVGDDSGQVFIELQFASTQAAGSVVTLKDADGNELLNHTAEKAFQSLTFTSAELARNEEYSLYVDGVRQQYTGNAFGMMGGGGFGPGGFGQGGAGQGSAGQGGVRPDNGQSPTNGQPLDNGTPPNGQFTPPDGSLFVPPEGGAMTPPDGAIAPPNGAFAPPTGSGGATPLNPGTTAGSGEGSDVLVITDIVHSFSGVSASAEASGKTRVTFTVNNGGGVKNVASGAAVALEQISVSADVPAQDIQITVTDVPSENYSETRLLSDGMDAIAEMLPTADGTYRLTVAVVSSNAAYSGVSQWTFTIGGLPFTDLSPADSAYTAIRTLYDKGVLLGTGAAMFSPDSVVTRAAAVTALGRLLGIEQSETSQFADVKSGSWYAGYVGWASANAIVFGDGAGRFRPNDGITSAQMDLILTRYAALAGIAYEPVGGDDHPLTRKEFATILAKLA